MLESCNYSMASDSGCQLSWFPTLDGLKPMLVWSLITDFLNGVANRQKEAVHLCTPPYSSSLIMKTLYWAFVYIKYIYVYMGTSGYYVLQIWGLYNQSEFWEMVFELNLLLLRFVIYLVTRNKPNVDILHWIETLLGSLRMQNIRRSFFLLVVL